jgi:phage terminase small subunit
LRSFCVIGKDLVERGERMLTTKQETFVQGVINGMSQGEAYKNAYDAESMSENAIDREASLLMKNPKIAQRHKELVDAIAKPTIMTAQERLEYLTEVIKGIQGEKVCEVVDGELREYTAPTSIKNKLSAIDLMNKMQGEYVTKVEGNVSVKLEDLL